MAAFVKNFELTFCSDRGKRRCVCETNATEGPRQQLGFRTTTLRTENRPSRCKLVVSFDALRQEQVAFSSLPTRTEYNEGSVKYKLKVAYDGSSYAGWQLQVCKQF
uniref:Uncharacterized protein n=1 Tax=Tetraselmis sp. GSL018 TaxID=582737 RepID=A0A061SIT3_9CHLO